MLGLEIRCVRSSHSGSTCQNFTIECLWQRPLDSFEPSYGVWYAKVPLGNKRAQRALGRSPEDKVKGHSGSNNREPQGHNLNNFARGPFDDVIY